MLCLPLAIGSTTGGTVLQSAAAASIVGRKPRSSSVVRLFRLDALLICGRLVLGVLARDHGLGHCDGHRQAGATTASPTSTGTRTEGWAASAGPDGSRSPRRSPPWRWD